MQMKCLKLGVPKVPKVDGAPPARYLIELKEKWSEATPKL